MMTCLLLACGDDKVVNESEDRIPPAPITDLAVVDTSTTTATLVWTAVGDDSLTGRAAAYDVRYSTSAITDSTWPLAFQCTGEPSPKDAGAIDTFVVTGLEPATVYYFAVKALDEANNVPHISNLVSQMTTTSNYVTWEGTYGSSTDLFSNSVVVASDGGYVVSGATDFETQGFSDACLLKIDEYGNLLWRKTFGGPLVEYIEHLINTPDGGYLLAGNAGFTDPADDTLSIYFVKTDASGNLEWETWYQRQVWTEIDALNLAHGGGYIASGGTISEFTAPYIHNYAFILKLSGEGEVEWWQPLDDTLDMRSYNPRDILATPDGGYLILDLYLRLVKTDGQGAIIWEKDLTSQVGIGTWHRSWRLKPCGNNEYVIVGGIIPHGEDEMDALLVKIDDDGNVIWSRSFGGEFYDFVYDVAQLSDGFVLNGVSYSLGNSEYGDVYLAKTDLEGNLLWERAYGWERYAAGFSLKIAPDGGFVLSGGRGAGPGTGVYYVIKTDPRGEL